MKDEKELPALNADELDEITGGAARSRKFRCPKCRQITMVVRYKSFKCTNPACGYSQTM